MPRRGYGERECLSDDGGRWISDATAAAFISVQNFAAKARLFGAFASGKELPRRHHRDTTAIQQRQRLGMDVRNGWFG